MSTVDTLDKEISQFMSSPAYAHWRARTEAARGCLRPIRLAGQYQIARKTTGEVLHDHSGRVMVPCGTRRASICPSCSERYAADAFHLIRAGLSGDESKGISPAVAKAPMVFATLTAPSFGAVHSRRLSRRGYVIPCACGERHPDADTRVGGAIDPDEYDYVAAVLWQAHVGELWRRWTVAVRRQLAMAAGIRVRDFRAEATISYSKVAEYQKRGLVHFHAVVRIDGPDGPGSPAPDWVTTDVIGHAITAAAAQVAVETRRPSGAELVLRWGPQVDVKPIDRNGGGSATIAGYIAKYATKDSGAADGCDRPLKSRDQINRVTANGHYRRMMRVAWDLGGLPRYDRLNLRRAAHRLGFRGHFLTKSQRYSVTLAELRRARQVHRMAELLASLDVTEDDITVINHWEMTGIGHTSEAQVALAEAIGDRLRNQHNRKE